MKITSTLSPSCWDTIVTATCKAMPNSSGVHGTAKTIFYLLSDMPTINYANDKISFFEKFFTAVET